MKVGCRAADRECTPAVNLYVNWCLLTSPWALQGYLITKRQNEDSGTGYAREGKTGCVEKPSLSQKCACAILKKHEESAEGSITTKHQSEGKTIRSEHLLKFSRGRPSLSEKRKMAPCISEWGGVHETKSSGIDQACHWAWEVDGVGREKGEANRKDA